MFISCMLLMVFQGTLFCNFLELHIYQECHLHNWKWESRNRKHFFFSPLIVMRCLCTPGHGRRLFATRIILNILLQNFLSMMVCLLAVSSFAFASLVVWKNLKMAFMFLRYRHGDFKCACFLCIWWSPLFLFQGIV